jgi:gamma-glutamyl hercynylcysteine S-oxide hydrolase
MCRLFAYAHGGSEAAMGATLDAAVLDQFHALSGIHRDGWGFAALGPGGRSQYLSSKSALSDAALFRVLTEEPLTSCIIHERLASPGIDLDLDNQQPFVSRGLAFAHNGTISNAEGNIVQRPSSYRESLGLVRSTTMSDSRIYADLFLKRLGEILDTPPGRNYVGGQEDLVAALSEAIRTLRQDYPDASYNSVIQTQDFTAIARSHTAVPVYSQGLRRIYEKAGWADRIESYYVIRYATFSSPDGSTTSVASSSGYPASDDWHELENDSVLLISHNDASLRVLALQ